jgi:hypothetical protein
VLRPSYNTWHGQRGPVKENILDLSRLDGGMNTWELDYRIEANQSPDMENMHWVDGALGSRKGQAYLNDIPFASTAGSKVHSIYEREFQDYAVIHAGSGIFKMKLEDGTYTKIYEGVTNQRGTFFVFNDKMYYLNGAEYLCIDSNFVVAPVVPYIPVAVISRKPDGTSGDMYQPENRLAAGKEVWFNGDGTSVNYFLPYTALDATTVTLKISGVTMVEGAGFTVDRPAGKVIFTTAPALGTNNVKIICYKTDTDTRNSIMSCRQVIVFGGETDLAVVVGGPTKQPNAYFWSGSHSVLDPTYFPFDYYNLAGSDAAEYITGFGKQQNMLIIFQSHTVGKAQFLVTTLAGRDYLTLPYTSINTAIGCDLPYTIQLVQNNLVFCNTTEGPCIILDTSNAGENNIETIGRNINGTAARPGLLADVRAVSAPTVSSVDDGQHYWIVANGHAYIWDYELSQFRGKEELLSWFYFSNINAAAWVKKTAGLYYGNQTGQISGFVEEFSDYGEAIVRRYKFATQFFKTYEVLKDVTKVILAVRSDTLTRINITYESDYELRDDPTPILAHNYKLVPRNLAYRILSTVRYAKVNVRNPYCFHVRHFSMMLKNNTLYTDMSLISAQIFYRFSGGDR